MSNMFGVGPSMPETAQLSSQIRNAHGTSDPSNVWHFYASLP